MARTLLAEGRPGPLHHDPAPPSPFVPARHSPASWATPSLTSGATQPETDIIDIRSSQTSALGNLDVQCLEGLSQPQGQKSLPSLLLWDEKGQMLYDDILEAEDYYPYRVENELMDAHVDEFAQAIAASRPDYLVELGAGNMAKTGRLLSALDRHLSAPLSYYALDVDRAKLERSLGALRDRTAALRRRIAVRGLLGTYDEGAAWLARPEARARRKALLWLGSSIANFEPREAGSLLASFATWKHAETGEAEAQQQHLVGILLMTDGCQDGDVIERAYNLADGASRRWMTYAVEAARRRLRVVGGGSDDLRDGDGDGDEGDEVDRLLADRNWRFEGQWHPERQRYENYLVPTRRLVGTIRGYRIQIEEGERVALLQSGKWTESTLRRVGLEPGLEVGKSWRNAEFDYGVYWLQPSSSITSSDSSTNIAETPDEADGEGGAKANL